MSSQVVPIHRTDGASSSSKKEDIWFNAFDYQPGQDQQIRWLSRPNKEVVVAKRAGDAEKFRITFDVENFKPEQIKIYIQNRRLTISGVYEERTEHSFTQKQFEKTFDIPATADVEAMASFITSAHMLVVEIPLTATPQVDHLDVSQAGNNQRRLSFSLNKFNSSNNNDISSITNDLSSLAAPGQQVRRTSITKTTTTTTTSGSDELPPEIAKLLKNSETSTGSTQTFTSHKTEQRSTNQSSEPSSTIISNLTNLPIEIPPELLATGGTITIQKRKVSVSKGVDSTPDQGVAVPVKTTNESQSTTSKTTSTTSSTTSNNTSSTTNQQQTNTSERRGSKTISSNNQSRMMTLEEFLENKTWNPTLIDGPDGKKLLKMRLQMKPGTTSDQMKISLNGFDLRIEVNNKVSADHGRYMNEHSYRQITLFPTCEVDQLKTELKDDGYLHIQVPMKL